MVGRGFIDSYPVLKRCCVTQDLNQTPLTHAAVSHRSRFCPVGELKFQCLLPGSVAVGLWSPEFIVKLPC
jgi:hypothetical protein